MVKLAKSTAEKAKVGIRKARQKGISDARKRKGEVSADSIYRIEKHVSHCMIQAGCTHALKLDNCFFLCADSTNDGQTHKDC